MADVGQQVSSSGQRNSPPPPPHGPDVDVDGSTLVWGTEETPPFFSHVPVSMTQV